jgi:dolichyl-phosphate beta-glucosyltransferase
MITSKPYLSVIIPAYNEADNFAKGALPRVTGYLSRQKYSWELLLINDGSSDQTLSLMRNFASKNPGVSVIDNPHQGKAATIISGALASNGEIVLFSDMDQATPISEVEKMLVMFKSGADIVIGSRAGRKGAPLFRQVLAYGMVIFRTIVLRLPYKDTQCGFKAFSRVAAGKIFPLMARIHPPHPISGPAVNPGFDVELLYLGRKLGFRISEVPVVWQHQDSKRVSFIHDAIEGVKELLLVRWRSLTNTYGNL